MLASHECDAREDGRRYHERRQHASCRITRPVTSRPSNVPRRQPLFRREERRELRYQLSISIAVVLSWLLWLIPGPVRGWIGDRGGDLFFRFSKTYRENVLSNVAQVAAANEESVSISDRARHIFRTSGRNFLDLMTMPRHRPRVLINSVRLTEGGWPVLDEALAQGNGAVLITAHLGCFDFIGQTISAKGYKLTVVTGRTTSRFIFDGVTYLRGSKGLRMVEPTPSGVRSVIQALRRGEVAVFVTDRDFFQNGMPVRFFGRETTLPPGAVRIARERRAPIVPIAARRVDKGHELAFYPAITVPKTADITADLQIGLERMVEALERGISGTPDQWVMFQRVWPEVPVEPVRVFPVGSPLESELLERVASALPERLAAGDAQGGRGRKWRPKGRKDQPPQSES